MRISSTSKYHPVHSRRRSIQVPFGAQRFLAAFEGLEGGFAISASIVVALSVAGIDRELLLVTAVVGVIVNGFNNASVKYSSEHYLDQLDGKEEPSAFTNYFIPALIEFLSYFAISFISIIPLMLMPDTASAVSVSVIITLSILYGAGWWRAYMLHVPQRQRDALETMLLGVGIIIFGLISGLIVHSL